MISDDEGNTLIRLAKKTVENRLKNQPPYSDKELEKRFSEKQGVFVTIHKRGDLRGCIGFPEPIYPLYKGIILASQYAAFEDPRFPPISVDEWDELKFELSILTVPKKIERPFTGKIKIGRDGLIIRAGGMSGLLLPQVATEYRWTPEEFLSYTCQKAGLPMGRWKQDDAEVLSFQAQIFYEDQGETN